MQRFGLLRCGFITVLNFVLSKMLSFGGVVNASEQEKFLTYSWGNTTIYYLPRVCLLYCFEHAPSQPTTIFYTEEGRPHSFICGPYEAENSSGVQVMLFLIDAM